MCHKAACFGTLGSDRIKYRHRYPESNTTPLSTVAQNVITSRYGWYGRLAAFMGVSPEDDVFLLGMVRFGAEAEAQAVVVESPGLLTGMEVMELHRDLVE